jgi:hypothetical protein
MMCYDLSVSTVKSTGVRNRKERISSFFIKQRFFEAYVKLLYPVAGHTALVFGKIVQSCRLL